MVCVEESRLRKLRLEKLFISLLSCEGRLKLYAYLRSCSDPYLSVEHDSADHALIDLGMQLQTTMLLVRVVKP